MLAAHCLYACSAVLMQPESVTWKLSQKHQVLLHIILYPGILSYKESYNLSTIYFLWLLSIFYLHFVRTFFNINAPLEAMIVPDI